MDQRIDQDSRFPQSDATVGASREEVRNLQRYLRTLSYVYPEIPSLPIDGIFDMATRDALIAFQKSVGLLSTGIADFETWKLLYSAYLDVLFDSAEPTPLPIFPLFPIDYAIRRGESGFLVAALQFLIDDISTAYGIPTGLSITGAYDEATERSVKALQRLFLLPETGEVNKRLWNYIVGAYIAEDRTREQTLGNESESI